jgi:hypothetical protein
MSQRSTMNSRPVAFSAGLLAVILAGAPAIAGEKIVEVAPSKPGPQSTTSVKPIDPVLDHILNSGKLDSGFNPGTSSPLPVNPQPSQSIDPALQKRWGAALDKRRNWLLENAATIGAKESGAFKANEDSPRFSQPMADPQKSGFGDRYLRATQTVNSAERQLGNASGNGEIDPSTGQPRSFLGIGGSASGSGNSADLGTNPSSSIMNRIGASGFSEQGRFSTPGQAQVDLSRQAAATDRAAIFDRLLSGSATATPGATPDAAASTVFSLTRTPVSRAQQFQQLLAGPEPQKTPSATAFGSSAFGTSTGLAPAPGANPNRSVLPGLAGLGDRTVSPSAVPGSAPTHVRPAAPKFEARPALLPIPKRGF